MSGFEWEPDQYQKLTGERPILPAIANEQEVQQWYNQINSRPQPAPTGTVPKFEPVPVQRLVKGSALFAGVLCAGYIGVQTVAAIAGAAVAFVSAYAIPVGGAVVGCVLIWAVKSGSQVDASQGGQQTTNTPGNIVVNNITNITNINT